MHSFLVLQVVDPVTGEVLGSGKNGEICIKSPLVMLGYAGNPAATATILDEDGWLHTGKTHTWHRRSRDPGPTTKGMMEANCLQFQPGGIFAPWGFKTFLIGKHYGIFLEQ